MKRILTCVSLAALAACGVAPNKRLVTRPDDYNKMIAFGQDGAPVDIRKIEREFPELKGIVMTAPEYIEEFARIKAAADAKGESVIPYRIPAGSQISIEVEDEPNLTRTVTVPPTGYYYYPAIGKVRMEGLTLEELKADMETKLARILKRPVVNINILSAATTYRFDQGFTSTPTSAGNQIYVFGAVSSAFQTTGVEFTGGQTLVSVLGRTGFPGSAEWRQVRVIRRDPVDSLRKSRVIICDLWNFFALADVRQDIPLMPGDVIYVPVKWTLGDQFQKDWNLVLGYMRDALQVDSFKDAFRKGGAFREP